MTPYPLIVEIDSAIQNLANKTGDPQQIANTISKGINLLSNVIQQLREENAELVEETEDLMERIEELERDQEVILEFLKSQEIDITFTIRKEKSDD